MMELARAIEILDPEHRELYYEREGGLEEVTEACRMGMEALKAQLAAADETMTAAQQEIDAITVVRCRDCKKHSSSVFYPDMFFCTEHGRYMNPDGYCSYGERREGSDNA